MPQIGSYPVITNPQAVDLLPVQQDSSGSLKLSTIQNIATLVSDILGVIQGAPLTAKYILQTSNPDLGSAQVLGSLASGILKNTTTTGVLSIAAAGTDYVLPGAISSAGLTTATDTLIGRSTAGTGNVESLSTIPSAIQDNITRLGTIVSGVWSGTTIVSSKIATALTGKTYNGVDLSGVSTPALAVTGSSAISGTNTGDQNLFGSIAVAAQTTVTASANPTALTLVAGSNIAITTDNTTKSITIAVTGTGTIGGSTGATDNALIRANGAGGVTIQSSGITVSDSNDVTIPSTSAGTAVILSALGSAASYIQSNFGKDATHYGTLEWDSVTSPNNFNFSTFSNTYPILFRGAYQTFGNGATERFRLSSTGNILIGTTADTGLTGAGGISVASATDSSSTSTGCAIFVGGVGIAKKLFLGGAFSGTTIKTSAPSGSTAGVWKLGDLVTAAVTPDTTRSIFIDIGGVVYKVIIAQ